MYTIKELNKYGVYQVALFDGHKEPDKVYKVHLKGNSAYCSCPGFPKTPGHSHKHIRLVKEWLKAGSPWLADCEIEDKQILIKTNIPTPKLENYQ